MYTQNNNNTVSVNFLIHVDSATSAPDESEYDFIFDLKPTARALPFEPFLTLLRLEFESQPRHLENVLAHTSLTKRLQQSLFAWVTNAEYPTIEPTIPVEFQFEQSIIRKALFELIQTAFLRKKLKIRIKNTQYLAASSSELVQEIKSHGSSRLTIDLALEANQFNDWWPQGDTQRQLKHRFLTSGIDCGEISQQTHQISIALDKSSISQHFFWANQLYCGDELYQLVSISSLQDNDETNSLMHVSYSLRAAIFLYQQEDAHRLASRIESANWSSLSSTETAFVFESLYLSKVWFWHYQHAASVASNYVKWAIEFGTEQNVAYSLLLKINTAFLLGKFRYSAIDCRALEEKLLTLKWSYLFGYLTSSYWFDHEHTLDASAQLLSAGRFALQQAIDDENLAAESRSLHYLSIVYLQIGSLNKALHYIDQSIEKSRGLTSHERTYNALNGRAYLLMQMANFDAALTSVERAFSFVVSDGNYEQICTTMCNAALIALFSDHFGNAIKLIDDIFQIMHLRGLNHTRFRSNVELKAIQAVAAFLKGDHRISIAIFKTRKEEDNHTLEGKFFSQLMTIAEYHYEVGTGKTDSRLNELFDTACHTYRHPFMALWILRFQREILKNDYPDQQKIINNKGFEYCQKFNLTSCESWFSEPLGNTDVQRFSARFLKLKALKLTQREAQIDLLKVENNLLKLALDLERYAHNCTDPLTLYDFCLTQLEKIQKYPCSNCDTLKSMGLCFPDDFCSNIKGPVGYYIKKTYKKI